MASDLTSQSQPNLESQKLDAAFVYEFENFCLNAANLMLFRDGEAITLAPKVVETLLALVERRGEIVSKREMMNRLWADSFVEDANLTQNVYLLRKTLGKGADGRDLIETFRRRGYRFTGEIRRAAGKSIEDDAAEKAFIETVVRSDRFDSLAVLPLTNESADETTEYLSDGITESIINRLSQIAQLRVVARNTVFQYKNRQIEPPEIGRRLKVGAILTGRILQHAERLIVRAELVETTHGWQIWGEQYDRPVADVLELQETIAREIAENLRLKLTGEERRRVTKRWTESSEAYHLYIKARFYLNKRLTESIERAAALFQQAIDVDPAYAPAYVGLADCFPLLSLYGSLTPREAYPQAKAAAEKALEIDPLMSKAYNSLGVVKLFYEWDWRGAEAAFRRAIELNPHYADAHQRYGMLLTAEGRFDEAVAEFKLAREFDPLSLIIKTISGYPFYYSREFEPAKAAFREVIAADEKYSMAHFRLGLAHAQTGDYAEAVKEIGTAVELSNDRDSIAALGYVAGLAGDRATAADALAELAEREKTGFVTSYNRALLAIGLKNYESALDWLERAFEERSYWLIYLKVDPALDALRESVRFKKLEEKIFGANDFEVRATPAAFLEKSAAPGSGGGSNKRFFAYAAIASAVLLLAIFAVPRLFDSKTANPQKNAAAPNLKITRLTPDLDAVATDFTPDGKHAVYILLEKGRQSVWLKDLATGGATQILPPSDDGYEEPQFSGDGKWIFFAVARPNKPNRTLVRVPSAGGAPEEIAYNVISPFAFSPDEKQVAFINGDAGDLHLAETDGGSDRVLARRDPKKGWFESWGSNLSWSAVHNLIAVCGGRYDGDGKPRYKLLLINPLDGAETVVPTPDWNYLDDVRWLGDGSGFVVVARETEASPFQIWRVSYPDGATQRITNDLNDYTNLTLSPDSRRILTNRHLAHLNLWLAPADAPERAKQITFSSTAEDGMWGVAFAPDGGVIYTSPRGGAIDLWRMNPNGGEPQQLTKNAGEWNGNPIVTPDGRYIIFVSKRSGRNQIWRMDADGGSPRQLTDEFWAGDPSLSSGGTEIYFRIDDGEQAYIAKIPLDGSSAPVRVSKTPHNSVGGPVPSPDGKFIFCQFYDRESSQPWKTGVLDTATGELIKVFDFHIGGTAVWTLDSKALIYNQRHNANLWRISLEENSKPQQITNYESGGAIRTFAASPDFKQFAVSRGTATYEAVLLENF